MSGIVKRKWLYIDISESTNNLFKMKNVNVNEIDIFNELDLYLHSLLFVNYYLIKMKCFSRASTPRPVCSMIY